ncbi:MAG: nucleotidyltransferase domain-containing protein [Planctomycetes bacterium]|nr:nucleotidyltransferase domain-containing protein [Planctomycetota bacterium]
MAKKELLKISHILLHRLRDKGVIISKIIVFGSYTSGRRKQDSDIDIVIVSKDFRNKTIFEKTELTLGIHFELVKTIMKPFDLLYYSDKEWERGSSLMINAAKEEGMIVFQQ